jgi:hypothetical protein
MVVRPIKQFDPFTGKQLNTYRCPNKRWWDVVLVDGCWYEPIAKEW